MSDRPIFKIAREYGLEVILIPCKVHGKAVDHEVASGWCLRCMSETDPAKARDLSWQAGKKDYFATCETHGLTPWSTLTGRCLKCRPIGKPLVR